MHNAFDDSTVDNDRNRKTISLKVKKLQKRSFIIVTGLLFLFIQPIYAGHSTLIESEGNACMGDNKSRQQTEQTALVDAKKKAVEYVSNRITSETGIKNTERKQNLISAYANADVEIIQELGKIWYKDTSLGDCFKIKVVAEITPDQKKLEEAYTEFEIRCSERAGEYFKNNYHNWQKTDLGVASEWDYHSHYNITLNKCFIVIMNFYEVGPYNTVESRSQVLYEIFENKSYGDFHWNSDGSTTCHMQAGKKTKCSDTEWSAFVKLNMEN